MDGHMHGSTTGIKRGSERFQRSLGADLIAYNAISFRKFCNRIEILTVCSECKEAGKINFCRQLRLT